MARPHGSKNKTRTVKAAVDYAAVVAEKTAEKEKIESEVASLTANLIRYVRKSLQMYSFNGNDHGDYNSRATLRQNAALICTTCWATRS